MPKIEAAARNLLSLSCDKIISWESAVGKCLCTDISWHPFKQIQSVNDFKNINMHFRQKLDSYGCNKRPMIITSFFHACMHVITIAVKFHRWWSRPMSDGGQFRPNLKVKEKKKKRK